MKTEYEHVCGSFLVYFFCPPPPQPPSQPPSHPPLAPPAVPAFLPLLGEASLASRLGKVSCSRARSKNSGLQGIGVNEGGKCAKLGLPESTCELVKKSATNSSSAKLYLLEALDLRSRARVDRSAPFSRPPGSSRRQLRACLCPCSRRQ